MNTRPYSVIHSMSWHSLLIKRSIDVTPKIVIKEKHCSMRCRKSRTQSRWEKKLRKKTGMKRIVQKEERGAKKEEAYMRKDVALFFNVLSFSLLFNLSFFILALHTHTHSRSSPSHLFRLQTLALSQPYTIRYSLIASSPLTAGGNT